MNRPERGEGYGASARWYDVIYGFKDYAAEAEALRSIIDAHRPGARRLLDVACGTGEHLRHLQAHFHVTGIDASPDMLAVAREKLPDVPLHLADMRSFDLGETYDAAICMFGAMGHLADAAEVTAAIGCIARHLTRPAVLIVEPWLSPEVFQDRHPSGLFVDQPALKLARLGISRRQGDRAILDMHHLVASPEGVESFVERMELSLFPHEVYRQAMLAAGMEVAFDPKGPMDRGLFTGTLPA